MANEIQYRHGDTGQNLYAVIVNNDPASADFGKYWSTAGTPAWEACTVANWANYVVTLTETPGGSYRYIGTFPAGIVLPGVHDVLVFARAGAAAAAITDCELAEATVVWSGAVIESAEKAMEAILAVIAGDATFDPATGIVTYKKQDGTTTGVTYTLTGSGVRTNAAIT